MYRDGKYDNTCVVALQSGALSSNGERQVIFLHSISLKIFNIKTS